MGSLRIVENKGLTHFATTAHAYRERLADAWLIAPWFSSRDERSALSLVVETFSRTSATLNVITRPPLHGWHNTALQLLLRLPNCMVCTCPTLHSKLYLLRCGGFRSALIGSPNFTEAAERVNLELAIEVRTSYERKGDAEADLITKLEEYAAALRREDDVSVLEGEL